MQEDWRPSFLSDAGRKTSALYFRGNEAFMAGNQPRTASVVARSGEEAPGMLRAGSEMEFLAAFADSQPDAQPRRRSSGSDRPKATLIRICPPSLSESQQHEHAAPFHHGLSKGTLASDLRQEQAAAGAEASHLPASRCSSPLHLSTTGSRPPWNSPLPVPGGPSVRQGRLLSVPTMVSLLSPARKATVAERSTSLPQGKDPETLASPRHWQLLSNEVLCEELEDEASALKAATSPVKPSRTHSAPATNNAGPAPPPVHRSKDPSLIQGGRMLSLGPSAFSFEPQLSLTSSALAEYFAMEQAAGDVLGTAPGGEPRGLDSSPQSAATAWEPSGASLDAQSEWQLETSHGAFSACGDCTCEEAGGGLEEKGVLSLKVGEPSAPLAGPAATGSLALGNPPEALSPTSQDRSALHDDFFCPAPAAGDFIREPSGRLQSFDSLSQYLLPEALESVEPTGAVLPSEGHSWESGHEGGCTCMADECVPWDDAQHGKGDSISILTSDSGGHGHFDEGCSSGVPGDDCDGVCQCEADHTSQGDHPCSECTPLSPDGSQAVADDICQCGHDGDCDADAFLATLEVPEHGQGHWCTTSSAQSGGAQIGAGHTGAWEIGVSGGSGSGSGSGKVSLPAMSLSPASGGVQSYASCPSSPAFSSCTTVDAGSPSRLGMPPPTWPPQNLITRNTHTNLMNNAIPVTQWQAQSPGSRNSDAEVTDARGTMNNGPTGAPASPKLLQLPPPLPIEQVPGSSYAGAHPAPQPLARIPSQQVSPHLAQTRPQEPLQAPLPATAAAPGLRAPFPSFGGPGPMVPGPSKPYKRGGWTAFLMEPLMLPNGVTSPALPASALNVSLTAPPPLLGVPCPAQHWNPPRKGALATVQHHFPTGASNAPQLPVVPKISPAGKSRSPLGTQQWVATANACQAGARAVAQCTPLGGGPSTGLHGSPAPVVQQLSPWLHDASAAQLQPQARAPALEWAQGAPKPPAHMQQQLQALTLAKGPAQGRPLEGPEPQMYIHQQRQAQMLGMPLTLEQSTVVPQGQPQPQPQGHAEAQAQGVAARQATAHHYAVAGSPSLSQHALTAPGSASPASMPGRVPHSTGVCSAGSPAVPESLATGVPAVVGSWGPDRVGHGPYTVGGQEGQCAEEAHPEGEGMCSCGEEEEVEAGAEPEAEAQRESPEGEARIGGRVAGAKRRRNRDSGFRPRSLFQERTNEGPMSGTQEAAKRARSSQPPQEHPGPSKSLSPIHDILNKGPRALLREYSAEGYPSGGDGMPQGGAAGSKKRHNRSKVASRRGSGHKGRRLLKAAKGARKVRAKGGLKSKKESESGTSDEDIPLKTAQHAEQDVSGQDLDN